MTNESWRERWLTWGRAVDERMADIGLPSLTDAVDPLAPVLTQLLWLAHPMSMLIGQGEAVDALAQLLEDSQHKKG